MATLGGGVKRQHYMTMTASQAQAAFDLHLSERPGALDRLRGELAADGQDADALLDGTPASLTPLWQWLVARILATGELDVPFDPDPPAPEHWPGWARHGGLKPSIPDNTVALLDGFISYVEEVVLRGAPGSTRTIVKYPVKRYYAQNMPGFAGPSGALTTPALRMVSAMAGGVLRGHLPVVDTQFTDYAEAMIDTLTKVPEPLPDEREAEPLLEVTLEGGEFDVSLNEELAHEHSRAVDRMVKALRAQEGVRSAHREDREVLLVRAPGWSEADLERWLTEWLQREVPAVAAIG